MGKEESSYQSIFKRYRGKNYFSLESLEERGLESLLSDLGLTKSAIKRCYSDTRFWHIDIYEFCSAIQFWPDFCKHPRVDNFTLDFTHLNSEDADDLKLLHKYENWFNKNRKEIAKKVAEKLSIPWESIVPNSTE